jgi:cyclopropane fatty-acyl-phospholipid synthase-like methyltransferase
MSAVDMNADAVASWETNAAFWDETMGNSGNEYYQVLELPALARMAAVKPGEMALDLATGNGLVAHWLASQGAIVVATDASSAMLARAAERGAESKREGGRDITGSISYQLLDVTSPESFEEFTNKEAGRVRLVSSFDSHTCPLLCSMLDYSYLFERNTS